MRTVSAVTLQRAPAYQFYPGDEERDAGVRGCSLAAYGLWKRMQNIMHDAAPYGHLMSCGRAMPDTEIARLVGSTPREVKRLLSELEARQVFSRTDDGVMYSRRMVRDEHIRNVRRHAGKTGGNPVLIDPPPVNTSVNGEDKQTVDLLKQKDKHDDNQTPKQILTPAVAVASAVAVAGTTDNTDDPLPRARDALRGQMPDEYRGDLDRLLQRMRSDGARLSWVFNLAHLLQDETPNGPQVPTEVAVLGAAIRQFNGAEETSWIRFLGYARKITSEPNPGAAGLSPHPNGSRAAVPRGGRPTASDRISAIIAGSTNGTPVSSP